MNKTKEITIECSTIVNASVDLVWYAWTISERISEWLAPQAVIDARIGGSFELYFIPGNTSSMNTRCCKIINIIEKEFLEFSWKGPDPFDSLMNQADALTTVCVRLEKIDIENTKVIIRHEGFNDKESWKEALEWHHSAWTDVLRSLKSSLEKGEGNLCCQPI
jgi:uncharacterized protein YndB with AHSA1/START domain